MDSAPPVPDRLVGERIGGRFVIERLIGAGPLSSAFRARDDLLQRRVTVKLFHPQHADDAAVVGSQLELATAVARLSHPNLVLVIDRGEHEGMPFVVLEYVRGENLQERIDRFAPLSVAEVSSLGVAIARALTHAHAHDVVHGNLRPANVLISEDREVKLVDFGGGSFVAALVGGDPYLAPEALDLRPGAPADPLHDVYALGVLLWVALTEQPPGPEGITLDDVLLARPDVSARMAAAIARATAPDPDARFETMRAFAAELAASGRADGGATDELSVAAAPASGGTAEQAVSAPAPAGAAVEADHAQASPAVAKRSRRRAARSPREQRARLVAWAMGVIPVLALVLVGVMIAGERGGSQQRTHRGKTTAPQPLHAVAAASVTAFDPPPGDGAELDDELANVIDGDPDTTWQTEGYDNERLGGIKPGVGFYVTLARPAAISRIVVRTDLNGWTVRVYGADIPEAAKRLEDWQPVSEPVRVVNREPIAVDTDGHRYGAYLLWITTLSLDDRFRARLGGLTLSAGDDPVGEAAPAGGAG